MSERLGEPRRGVASRSAAEEEDKMEAAGEAAPGEAAAARAPALAAFVAPLEPDAAPAVAAALPEWLQQREAARLQDVERQRQQRQAQAVREERSEFVVAALARQREAVEASLAAGQLEEAAAQLQALQRLLTESVRCLAPYEVRQGQEAVTRLQAALAARRQQLQPKKKFAFRARKKEGAAGAEQPRAEPEPAPAPAAAPGCAEGETGEEPLCGFSGLEGAELELGRAELLQRDVVLSGLRGCRVQLRGSANTLRMRDCHGCTVLCGPFSTSAFVDGCSECVLVLACHQLRTHRTRRSRFYVHVSSRAIIEDCAEVAFAPYSWSYPGIEEDFEASALDRSSNNWNTVDDFNWLSRDKPSPNWSLIPEQERIVSWD